MIDIVEIGSIGGGKQQNLVHQNMTVRTLRHSVRKFIDHIFDSFFIRLRLGIFVICQIAYRQIDPQSRLAEMHGHLSGNGFDDTVRQLHHLRVKGDGVNIRPDAPGRFIKIAVETLICGRTNHRGRDFHFRKLVGNSLQTGVAVIVIDLIISVCQNESEAIGITAPLHLLIACHHTQRIYHTFRAVTAVAHLKRSQRTDHGVNIAHPVGTVDGVHARFLVVGNIAIINDRKTDIQSAFKQIFCKGRNIGLYIIDLIVHRTGDINDKNNIHFVGLMAGGDLRAQPVTVDIKGLRAQLQRIAVVFAVLIGRKMLKQVISPCTVNGLTTGNDLARGDRRDLTLLERQSGQRDLHQTIAVLVNDRISQLIANVQLDRCSGNCHRFAREPVGGRHVDLNDIGRGHTFQIQCRRIRDRVTRDIDPGINRADLIVLVVVRVVARGNSLRRDHAEQHCQRDRKRKQTCYDSMLLHMRFLHYGKNGHYEFIIALTQ